MFVVFCFDKIMWIACLFILVYGFYFVVVYQESIGPAEKELNVEKCIGSRERAHWETDEWCWNAYEILILSTGCLILTGCFGDSFDRLDFSGQPNLTQWIKTVSQQVKALHLLRNEDCASKSEEICIFVCENVFIFMEALWFCHNGVEGWWHKWQEQLGISVSGGRISDSASAPFYNVEITYRWIIVDLLLSVVQAILVIQKKWISCKYLKDLDQISNWSMYLNH